MARAPSALYGYGMVNPLEAVQSGRSFINDFAADLAQRQAGQSLAVGDYAGASGQLYRSGQLSAGAQVQGLGQEQEDRQAAQAAALRKEQMSQQDRMLVDQQRQMKERAAFFKQTAQVLKGVPMQERSSAVQSLTPSFQALGVSPEDIQKIQSAQLDDNTLNLFIGEVDKAEQYTLSPGSRRYDARGNLVAEAPFAPEYRTVGEGQSLVELAPPSAMPTTGSPRGLRNNNPGNVKALGGGQQWQGQTGVDANGFAVFDSMENGQRAMQRNLQSYGRQGVNTVGSIINRWAPSSDNNPTSAYVQYVASQLGVRPDQPLDLNNPQTLSALSTAIARFENGPQSASSGTQGGARVVAQGAAKSTIKTLSPQEVQAAGFLPGTVVQQSPDGRLNVVQRTSGGTGERKAEADLRKEFNARPEVKEYRDVSNSYRTIEKLSSGEPTAAGDLSMIFAYMKMLDPGSVVREGEFATAQNAAGIPDQVRNAYNRAASGQRLNARQRQDFTNQARQIYQTRKGRFDEIAGEYRSYAQDYGVSADRVVMQEKAQPPVPGARQGKDNNFYIEDPNKKGSFPMLRQAADGNWYIKSASGNWLRAQ